MRHRKVRSIVGSAILAICFYFIGKSLLQNWHTVSTAKLKFNIGYLVLSCIFMVSTYLLVAYTWKRNVSILKEKINFLAALRVNALSTLPKYAPGKVWGILGKVYLAKKEGISEHTCVITISLETILYILGGIILFLFTGASVLKGRIPYTYCLILILIFLIIIYPRILIGTTNVFLKLFKRPLIDFMPSYFQILTLLCLYTLSWIFQGIGVYFLINSFYPIALNKIMLISGIHAFSWVVGFLTIITPAGLGIKEGVLSYFLTFIMPSGIAILVALVIRLWGTISEVIFFSLFLGKIKKYL